MAQLAERLLLAPENPEAGPIKILQRKFYTTLIFKHSDWLLKIFNQSEYLKNLRSK